jgi:hypothetical protein
LFDFVNQIPHLKGTLPTAAPFRSSSLNFVWRSAWKTIRKLGKIPTFSMGKTLKKQLDMFQLCLITRGYYMAKHD